MSYTSAYKRKLEPIIEGFKNAHDGVGDRAIISYLDELIDNNTHTACLHDIILKALEHFIKTNEPEYSAAILRRATWAMSSLMVAELKNLKIMALEYEAYEIAQQIAAFHSPIPSTKPIPQTILHSKLNL